MISLDSEPNPFRSFSYSLTMDGGGRGGGRVEEDEASQTPRKVRVSIFSLMNHVIMKFW